VTASQRHDGTLVCTSVPKSGDRIFLDDTAIIVLEVFHDNLGNYIRYQYEDRCYEHTNVWVKARLEVMP
jgi:hypothetical protein